MSRKDKNRTASADAEITKVDGAADTEREEDFFEEKEPPKKKKRVRRKDMTPEQRKRRRIRDLIITGTVFGVILLFFAICALCSFVGYKGNFEWIAGLGELDYESEWTLVDIDDEANTTGYYEFVPADNDPEAEFTVLQLTDVHIGAGAFSAKKDRWAMEAVTSVIRRAQPDLVVVSGDIAYPVPFQAGTFNNKREAEMFATLMEELGVYWTLCFGNHDTEAYSLYTRDEIGNFYQNDGRWEHCLFRKGPEDVSGVGNDMIVVKDYQGKIIQSIVTVDSHSYTDGDILGIAWKYDNIHDDQMDWYASEIQRLTEINKERFEDEESGVKNIMFFHIPLRQYNEYYFASKTEDGLISEDTELEAFRGAHVEKLYGQAGEKGEKSFPGMNTDKVVETMLANYGQGTFCGHDHYNTYALDIQLKDGRSFRLSYGMSIDYLAYMGIVGKIEQRGGQEIKISQDGSFVQRQRPYAEQLETDEVLAWR